jgi:hypothetical protein
MRQSRHPGEIYPAPGQWLHCNPYWHHRFVPARLRLPLRQAPPALLPHPDRPKPAAFACCAAVAQTTDLLLNLLLTFNNLIKLILTFLNLSTQGVNIRLVISELLLELS